MKVDDGIRPLQMYRTAYALLSAVLVARPRPTSLSTRGDACRVMHSTRLVPHHTVTLQARCRLLRYSSHRCTCHPHISPHMCVYVLCVHGSCAQMCCAPPDVILRGWEHIRSRYERYERSAACRRQPSDGPCLTRCKFLLIDDVGLLLSCSCTLVCVVDSHQSSGGLQVGCVRCSGPRHTHILHASPAAQHACFVPLCFHPYTMMRCSRFSARGSTPLHGSGQHGRGTWVEAGLATLGRFSCGTDGKRAGAAVCVPVAVMGTGMDRWGAGVCHEQQRCRRKEVGSTQEAEEGASIEQLNHR